MAQQQSFEIESINETGVGVRVRFTWRDDRFGHTIYFVRGETEIACVASCEGGSSDDWPPSPPIQEIHEQQNGDGKILFLTGMAGTGHWSMTVETRERFEQAEGKLRSSQPLPGPLSVERGPGRGESPRHAILEENPPSSEATKMLWFDAAVRVKSKPTLLGSSYRSLSPCNWIDMSGTLQAVGSRQAAVMFALPDGNKQAWHTPSTDRRLLNPHLPEEIHQPTTIQWSYGVASTIV